jgi:thioredoxin reductase (NADPH)
MRQPNVTVYGSRGCPDTRRAVKFLDGKQIPYEFKDVDESPEYNDYIAGLNQGKRVMPTIRVNNETFINPSDAELAQAVQKAGQEAHA